MICFRRGELRKRHHYKCDVPQRSSDNRAARNPAFNPGVLKETSNQKSLLRTRPAEQFREITGNALMKLTPGQFQLWLGRAMEFYGRRRWRRLTQKVERIVGFKCRHYLLQAPQRACTQTPIITRRTLFSAVQPQQSRGSGGPGKSDNSIDGGERSEV